MLSNSKVTLRAMNIADSELVRKWRFDWHNYDYFYEFDPIGQEQNRIWLEKALLKKNEKNFIIDRNDLPIEEDVLRSIGMISILNIDNRNQKCEIGRVLIGDIHSRNCGFGRNAIVLLLEYCFKHLNMRKVYCEVFADNDNAVSLYQKLGFKKEGLLKRHIYKDGAFKDVLLMALHRK
jgi:RimJ/RimL family protein N-acetyltransferase